MMRRAPPSFASAPRRATRRVVEPHEAPATRPESPRGTGRAGGAVINTYHAAVQQARRDIVTAALLATDGNRSRAARLLEITRNHVHLLMRTLGIDVPSAGPGSGTRPARRRSA